MRARILRRRGSATGLALIVLGVWGGLVPFVGPYFNYSMARDHAWLWQMNRLWLEILPGAAAVLGGLILIGAITRGRAMFGGLLGLAAGIWFVCGPQTSTLWEHGSVGVGPALGGTFTRWLVWMGYFYALGAAITALSAMVIGRMSALVPDVVTDAALAEGTVGTGAAATTARGGRFARDRAALREPAATPAGEPVHDPAPVDERPVEREPATASTTAMPEFASRGDDSMATTAPPTRRRTGRFLRRRRTADDRTTTPR